ncbi:unnamed protein product [Closterium sp. NIES-53]
MSDQRGHLCESQTGSENYPQTPHAEQTTHEAAGATGSRSDAAAAASGHRQNLPSEQLHPDPTTATATTPFAATTTPTAATTTATEAPTPATTPTATSATSTASTPSTTTTPAATSTTLASLALAAAALPTRSRSSPDLLNTKDVNSSSSRSVGGGKGGEETPLKEGCARSATSSTYSDYASLSCKEVLLEQVDSEVCVVNAKVSDEVLDCGKG